MSNKSLSKSDISKYFKTEKQDVDKKSTISKIRKQSGFKQKFLKSINEDPKKLDGMYDVEETVDELEQ